MPELRRLASDITAGTGGERVKCKRRRCNKRAGKLPPKPQAGVPRAYYELDPYCSRKCAELDNGIEPPAGIYTRNHEVGA